MANRLPKSTAKPDTRSHRNTEHPTDVSVMKASNEPKMRRPPMHMLIKKVPLAATMTLDRNLSDYYNR